MLHERSFLFCFVFVLIGHVSLLFLVMEERWPSGGTKIEWVELSKYTSPEIAKELDASLRWHDNVGRNPSSQPSPTSGGGGKATQADLKHRIVEGKGDLASTLYLEYWRQKVEKVGRFNYPAKAVSMPSLRQMRLLVTLRADGTVLDTQFLQDSGDEEINKAIIKIVELASPFAPVPLAVRGEAKKVEILANWKWFTPS